MTLYAYGVDCYYHVCLQGFLRASFNDVALQFHASSFIILNMPKTIDNIRSFLRMTALWFSIALCRKIRIFAVTGIIRRYIFEALCLSCSLKTWETFKTRYKEWHSGSHAMAWAATITSVSRVFSGPSTTTWYCSSTLLHFIILNMLKTIQEHVV